MQDRTHAPDTLSHRHLSSARGVSARTQRKAWENGPNTALDTAPNTAFSEHTFSEHNRANTANMRSGATKALAEAVRDNKFASEFFTTSPQEMRKSWGKEVYDVELASVVPVFDPLVNNLAEHVDALRRMVLARR